MSRLLKQTYLNFRDTGVTLNTKDINNIMDQVTFFSQQFPVFSKIGKRRNCIVCIDTYSLQNFIKIFTDAFNIMFLV